MSLHYASEMRALRQFGALRKFTPKETSSPATAAL